MAYANGFTYKRTVTIDHTLVSGGADLSNFPVLVSLTDVTLKTVANSGHVQHSSGFDIRFELADGTKLDHELELYVAATGQIIAWVKFPTLHYASDDVINLFYGKSGLTVTEENIAGVWSSFLGVYHLNEAVGAGATKDRTSNANHMSSSGSQLTGQIAGKINKAVQRTGSTAELSRLLTDANMNIGAGALWFSIWLRCDGPSLNSNAQFVWQDNSGRFRIFSTGSLAVTSRTYKTTGTLGTAAFGTLTEDVWYHLAIRVGNATGVNVKSYTNGANIATGAAADSYIGTNTPTALFSSQTAAQGAEASLSHFKVATTDLGAGWITTEYNNQNAPATFHTIGSETENAPAGGTKEFTVDALLYSQKTKTLTVDAYLLKRRTKTFTVDAKLLLQKAKTLSADALLVAWPQATTDPATSVTSDSAQLNGSIFLPGGWA